MHHTRPQAAHHPVSAADVAGEHARRQPVVRAVGHRNGGVFGVKGLCRQNGAKDLVLHQRAALRCVVKDRGGHVEPAAVRVQLPPTGAQLCARCVCRGAGVEDLVQLCPGRNRTCLRIQVQRVAHPHRFGRLNQQVNKRPVHRPLDQHPRSGDAHLSAVPKDTACHRLGRRLEVGVGKHHAGRLAPQLKIDALEVRLGRRLEQPPPHRTRPGKGQHVHIHVPRQRVARLGPGAGDDVQHAVRQARVLRDLAQPQQRQRCHFGGFQDDCVARRERGRNFPRGDHQREVPGHNRAHHAHRFVMHQSQRAGSSGRDLAVLFTGQLSVITEGACGTHRLGLVRHSDFGSVITDTEHRKLCRMVRQRVTDALQDPPAGRGREARPPPILKRRACGAHGAVDILGPACCNPRQHRPVNGRHRIQRCTAGRGHLTPVYQVHSILDGRSPQGIDLSLVYHEVLLRKWFTI